MAKGSSTPLRREVRNSQTTPPPTGRSSQPDHEADTASVSLPPLPVTSSPDASVTAGAGSQDSTPSPFVEQRRQIRRQLRTQSSGDPGHDRDRPRSARDQGRPPMSAGTGIRTSVSSNDLAVGAQGSSRRRSLPRALPPLAPASASAPTSPASPVRPSPDDRPAHRSRMGYHTGSVASDGGSSGDPASSSQWVSRDLGSEWCSGSSVGSLGSDIDDLSCPLGDAPRSHSEDWHPAIASMQRGQRRSRHGSAGTLVDRSMDSPVQLRHSDSASDMEILSPSHRARDLTTADRDDEPISHRLRHTTSWSAAVPIPDGLTCWAYYVVRMARPRRHNALSIAFLEAAHACTA